jgi:hypothetical protein
MEHNNEFEPAVSIETRGELALIFNALVEEKKLLVYRKRNPERQNAISIYLKELNIRDEELKVINKKFAAEKRSKYLNEQKKIKEQFMREHIEGLSQLAEDIRKYNAEKEELEKQKKEFKTQINVLEKELKMYSKKIGLDDLRQEYKKIEEIQKTHQIKTCCKHVKYKYFGQKDSSHWDEDVYIYVCLDCGFKFDDESTIFKNLKQMNILSL